MATASPSPIFSSLTGVWSLLALRSDIDDIILELLGRFSLEKIYADGDKESYADLILTLLVQLRVIFFIQRLTLPPVGSTPVGWSIGFLVSWEVTVRTVEFVLQIILEAREVLWDAPLRDEYLSRLLLSTVQILLLHPKPPPNSRLRDRRDRFERVHRALERVGDNYPDSNSSFLAVCRAISDALRAEPDALTLPPRLKQGLPSLTGDLYPLPDCLSPSSIAAIVPQQPSQSWLSQLLGLYDVSQFVVGANIQFAVNTRKLCDAGLERTSKSSRDAVLHALNRVRLPPYVSAAHLVPMISEDFRIVLPDTPSLAHRHDGNMVDALDALRERLSHRLMVHRVSDGAVMHSVSQITKYIELLDDPSDQLRTASPALYVVNCQECHFLGSSQVRDIADLTLLDEAGGASGVAVPRETKCAFCGSAVSMVREVSLARYTWEHLKPLSPNVEAINAERHLPTQFLLAPSRPDQPRRDSGTASGPSSPPPFGFSGFPQGRTSAPRAEPWVDVLPPLGNRRMSETPPPPRIVRVGSGDPPFSADAVGGFEPLSKSTTFTHTSSSSSGGIRALSPPASSDKSRPKWKSRFTTTKKEVRDHADASSLSSATLESQKLEEIDLKSLSRRGKHSGGGKFAQNIKVSLSQDSTYSLFWSQSLIQIWDVSTCPPMMKDAITTDGFCIFAAVTGTHVAYMTGDRDRKQTLWIKSLDRVSAPQVEYRVGPSPWCTSMAVSPSGSFVAVGFERSTVGLFTPDWQQPRLHRVHARYHQDCKDCPPIATVSFSHDGLVLVCSTRSERNGLIQVYLSHFPFSDFQEVLPCRYRVPLHESEDNGISSVHFQPGMGGKEDIICITTWTQSGVPILVHPDGGHRTEIRVQSSASSNHKGKLGNRIQAAAFSPWGSELVLVNDKGHVYRVSNLGSIPIEVRKVATTKEFTAKTESFALAYVHQTDEDLILLCWSDSPKGTGYVKKIPIITPGEIQHSRKSDIVNITVHPSQPELPEFEPKPPEEKAPEKRPLVKPPVELEASEISPPLAQRATRMGFFGSLHGKK